MPFSYYNPNPARNDIRDCAIRAVAKATDTDWDGAYAELSAMAYILKFTMDYNPTWGAVLRKHGFKRDIIPNTCPDCYTAKDFCRDYPKGTYVLAFDGHVATVIDGVLYDSYDTSYMIPQYFWYQDNEINNEEKREE